MRLNEVFSALGDPTRFAIVEQLLKKGDLSAGELHRASDYSAPAISRHLKILLRANIVERRVEKQSRIYAIRPEAVKEIHAWTTDHLEFWKTGLDRLSEVLNQEAAQNE